MPLNLNIIKEKYIFLLSIITYFITINPHIYDLGAIGIGMFMLQNRSEK